MAAVGVSQNVEAHRRRDLRDLAGNLEWSELVRLGPNLPIRAKEDHFLRALAGGPGSKTIFSVVSQDHMPDAAFGKSDRQRAAVRIVIAARQARQFGVAATRKDTGLNHPPEFWWTGIDQPPRFVGRQIAHHRLFDLGKRFDPAPGMVGGTLPA